MLIRRMALYAAALVCFGLAAAIVVNAGLPERATFTGLIRPGERPIAPEIDALAPPFQAQTADGDTLNLSDLRGQPVILNFWATWCEPCRVEMPELQAVYEAHQADGLRVVGINLGEAREDVLDWRDQLGLTFDLVLDPAGEITARYYLRGQPTTFVISREGVITHIFYGPTTAAALENALVGSFT
jgi:peroxiredoxin